MSDKLSPNGARILDGRGLQSVRDKIQQSFNAARESIPVPADVPMDCSNEISIIDPVALDKLILQIPTRPLREQSTPATVGRHRGGVYYVSVPKKSADDLIEQALRLMQKK
ncbi:MAG: hypothetical protein WBL50_16205 [Candidatus Acidiferrum sp.]